MSTVKIRPRTILARRQILRAAGGATMALPFLPSLLAPPRAYGVAVLPPRRRAFVAWGTPHGAFAPTNMYPMATANAVQIELFPGHVVTHAPLTPAMEGGDTVLSPILRAPSTALTPRLVSKMNVHRGFDIPFYLSHHNGGHLGNLAGNDGVAGGDQLAVQRFPNPTVDQVLAWSPSFYADLAGIRERSVTAGGGYSWNWSSPGTRSGTIQALRDGGSALAWFSRIFGDAQPVPGATATSAPRKPIVDSVLTAYKRLRDGSTRLSSGDRHRLDDFMDRMAELQRRLAVQPAASCKDVRKPAQDARLGYGGGPETTPKHAIFNDIMAASIICGLTRVFMLGIADNFVTYQGDWHQQVAHTANQSLLVPSYRAGFQSMMLDLAHKLDVDAGDGGTYLDQSLLHWSQESGHNTHVPMSQVIVTMGSAGRILKTGRYIDWRNMAGPQVRVNGGSYEQGVLINRWWSTVMNAFGIPRAEWTSSRNRGFGLVYFASSTADKYSAAHQAALDDPLPIVT